MGVLRFSLIYEGITNIWKVPHCLGGVAGQNTQSQNTQAQNTYSPKTAKP